MDNLLPSTFIGNVQWKIVKQMENSAFYSISCMLTSATANLFGISKMVLGI